MFIFTLLVYVNDSGDFLLTCSLYSYCCWFICQWLLWFIWTWQGAKPRTPINKQSNKFVSCLFACFRIQFLPDHIMIHSCLVWFLWWLRHGAIGPIEATPVGVNVDWIEFRIYTFELVIRLSKVQQLALRLCTFFTMSAVPDVPGFLAKLPFYQSDSVRNLQKLRFLCSFSLWGETWHMRLKATGMSFSCRCGLFGFWWGQTYCASNSLELESRFMPLWLTRTRAWIGTTHDF